MQGNQISFYQMAKNILLIQCYNANKGDNSVARTMIDSFRGDGYRVAVTAFDVDKAEKEYHVRAGEYLFSVWKARQASSKFLMAYEMLKEGIWFFYSVLFLFFYKCGIELPLPFRKRNTISNYLKADVIVLPGGHFFTSFNSLINNLSHYYAMRFAQLLGKKTMVYAQTVGPYKGCAGRIERFLANRVLSRCDCVTLRESNSLTEYNRKNCEVTAETVFMNPVPEDDRIRVEDFIERGDADFIVGVTIHHIYYKHYFSKEAYVRLMADIFDAILTEFNCKVLVIPMEDKSFSEGDRKIAREMINEVRHRGRIRVIDGDLNSVETANLIAKVDVFIGTKTHSVVYGLKSFTPTLSISYQQKSTEFMKMFGMERYAVPMGRLSVDVLMPLFRELLERRADVRRELEKIYGAVKEKVKRNNELLYKLLNDVST